MKIQQALLVILSPALLLDVSEGANLRKGSERKLIIGDTINSIVEAFTPALNGAIQNTLSVIPIEGISASTELGAVDFLGGSCTAYSLGALTGLDSFEMQTSDLVPGSDFLETSGFLGMGGATWEGTWEFTASFDSLSSRTDASIVAQACDFAIDEAVSG